MSVDGCLQPFSRTHMLHKSSCPNSVPLKPEHNTHTFQEWTQREKKQQLARSERTHTQHSEINRILCDH